MPRFNAEIFSRSFDLVAHALVDGVSISEDYLSPAESSVAMPSSQGIDVGQYIRLGDYVGVITAVEAGEDGYSEVRYKPFASVFAEPVLFDTDLQGTGTLEGVLADIITARWISNPDSLANIEGLTVSTISSTTGWGFHLTSDAEGMHTTIVNLYDSIISRALSIYRVGLYPTIDVQAKTIDLAIGVQSSEAVTIEADLPNVLASQVTVGGQLTGYNKAVIYNRGDYTQSLAFYLHPDGSYDQTNADRIVPVNTTIKAVDVQDGQTFDQAASAEAGKALQGQAYNNLIEVECLLDDQLIRPTQLHLGDLVQIISGGVQYTSILTGRALGDTAVLTFGTVRLDLTKIIKGAIYGS